MTTSLRVHAIDPQRLARIRASGRDEHGNAITLRVAGGGEPLRCCLGKAIRGEQIALIGYSPFECASPWAEVGPVFVHPDDCGGYPRPSAFPEQFRVGPRVLRAYAADTTMLYQHNTIVAEGEDVEAQVRRLLDQGDVAVVHLRALVEQCFTFAVTRDLR
ncbi:MAG TPA: DUF1203 domain-containing protein [Nocardioidaceae bacterium]|nr:DUF1203 domain-containing protein [Nocardioidaceae bacterium]